MTETEQREPIRVVVVEVKGQSALVETPDHRRWFVPADKVQDGKVDADTMDKAALYGIPWEAYLNLDTLTTETLAGMLRKAGIYTSDDLKQRDRRLIRIGTLLIGQIVQDAAKRACEKQPRRS